MEPITRKEKFLAKAGGQEVSLPEPITREEMFLAAIGGTSGGRGWVERKIVEETRYFEPSGPDGGFIDDLEFANLLYGNLDKATYTYNDVDVVEPNFVTLQDTSAYIETRIDTRTHGFMVQIRTDSNGNLTGQVWFGNDHFLNGSITIKGVKETVHKIAPKFLPEGYPYSIVPEIKAELNHGTNYDGALREDYCFYHLSDTVFTKPEEVHGLYITGPMFPYYYIDKNGKCKWYSYNFQTGELTYSNVMYEVVDVVDSEIDEVVGFNMIINESGRGINRDALCFIFKEATLNGQTISPGIYHDIYSAPLPMVSLATGYETEVYRLAPEYMPLLVDENGGKWKLTVSTSGALSAVKVDE